jgi:Protein of unknown function (DUF1574)
MERTQWRERAGRMPAGALGMLFLVLMVEGFVPRDNLDTLDADDWRYQVSRGEAVRSARGRDVLYFGDSLMEDGILPAVIERRSGLRGYNLAVNGSQPSVSYFLFRKALASGARPRAVVLECHSYLLIPSPECKARHLPYLLDALETLSLAWQSRSGTLFAQAMAGRVLPSLRCRGMLRQWVYEAFAGKVHAVRYQMGLILPHWKLHQGAQLVPSRHSDHWDIETYARDTYPKDWRPDPVNVEYLRRFFALAEANGVRTYWLLPPAHPKVQQAKERSGADAGYEAFVRSFQSQFSKLVVLDGRHAEYEPGVFFDPDHLGRDGAVVLSEGVGDALRHDPKSNRWVELPRYRARPIDPALTLAPFDKLFPNAAVILRR